ncbi:EAL domain-containing protein [Sphingomonas histidinilytica]|jgi:diguanylate cyclase (GGDEF)-like protein|uniref:Diguanylate cyclase/phosphodiesterase n=2 Tax=Rhizorhabdus histidinilytica TaxID=439228 RepID=A0A1T5A0C1_9SPHN|nr:EAL domain-containing protein [Rhizorhabdus histidinilytica]QEH78466.1 EAL domain-containing protein [Sphingomonas sp. C8-2]SKB28209.1 diguanylate cyclase/phosphodiesterase [Rhizorhabdus histidinilytica]
MRAAKTHIMSTSDKVGGDPALPMHKLPAALQELLDTPRSAAQQEFIDTLPIAIALVCLVDRKPTILARNRAFLQLVNRHSRRREIEPGRDLCVGIALPLLPEIEDFLNGDERDRSFDMQEGDGISGRHFAVRLSRLSGGESPVPRCILSLIDRTQQVEGERSLRTQMLRDSLTGLPNRAAFAEQVEQAMLNFTAEGRQFAVLLIDLTRFSRVNEGVGSLAGDELIITVARRLVSALRAGDVLARLAGDEFAVLLGVADDPSEAMSAARRMQACLATPIRLGDLEIKIDCAVGVAMMASTIDDAEDLIRNAQFAMKRAKQSGHAELYQAGDGVSARQRFSLETELRRAIERDQLHLAFQPLIELSTGRVIGFEALARWDHPEKGAISPVDFIPVAEESGLIVALGRWALRAATRTLAEWDRKAGAPLPVHMAVNVSAVQFQRDDVVSAVKAALTESGIAGNRLKIELTESCIVSDPDGIARVLRAIHDLDVTIAMDDFGTGYSSLAYLQRLPIDVLKIDRSFVAPMLHDRDSVAIVRAILGLASALGMATTAEGVESEALIETLIGLGCDIAQGYYFARPLPSDEAFAYLRSRPA